MFFMETGYFEIFGFLIDIVVHGSRFTYFICFVF